MLSPVAPASTRPIEHVYVHVPFCRRRCSYCDFSIAVRKDVPTRAFNDAIMAEYATRRIQLDPLRLRSIYLGGGTPSQLGGAGIADLLSAFRHRLGVQELSTSASPIEVTIEANPEDISPEAAGEWVAAGVGRVSLGVQSFDPEALRWMHRSHGPEAVRGAVKTLREAGVRNLSLDLIFALPQELGRDWERDLGLALELEPEHLSLYGLTVEPGTPLGRWSARGDVAEAPEETYAEEYLRAHERLTAAGFEHYEVSNFGLPGRHSVHNRGYWSGAGYLGLGPSAHGYDGSSRRWNTRAYQAWLEAVEAGRDPEEGREVIGESERTAEEVYLGLRTDAGLQIRQNEHSTVTRWVNEGWASLAGDRLRLTAGGWLRLDALATALTSLRSR